MSHRRDGIELNLTLKQEGFELRVEHQTDARVLGVFGPSGSGKTTLLESIAGLRAGVGGRLLVDGNLWLDSGSGVCLPPEQRRVGYVPQDHLLFPHWSVRRNLLSGSERAGRAGMKVESRLADVVETLQLQPLLDRSVAGLSGGERQRVALGRALCSGPSLLLLDEPLASLDRGLRQRVLPYLLTVRDHFRVPILLVSHDPVEIQALADEVLLLREGRMVAAGKPMDMLFRPEVYASPGAPRFENLLSCRIIDKEDHATRVRVGEEGPFLMVPFVEGDPASEVILTLPASDILLAREEPRAISARNRIPGKVESVRSVEGHQLVSVDVGSSRPLVAEVTADAVAELNLKPGEGVFLLIKSRSIQTQL